ncbi:putative transmembrane protein 217B [Notamacropus eugenii]|uniref:putative transmembrane protein 217B n=1 Tax=Notamacropus eugenii TaxID=9315 RepID=UPI003B670A44
MAEATLVRGLWTFWQQKCKLSPEKGSFMAGIFSILFTIQSLILDLNQTFSFGKDSHKFSIYKELHGVMLWTSTHKNHIIIFLSITTLLVSCFLLYSVQMELYLGLFVYVLWIVTYEIACFSLIVLISHIIHPSFQPIKYYLWINQISHMFIHAFWLPFVITYAHSLFKGPIHLTNKSPRTKKHSLVVPESWSHMGITTRDRKFT